MTALASRSPAGSPLSFRAGTAGAGAVRATGLRHEAVDHAVKNNSVVKTVLHQFLDTRDMSRRKVGAHLDHDFTFGGLQRQRIFWLRHITPSHNTHTTDRRGQRSMVAFLM